MGSRPLALTNSRWFLWTLIVLYFTFMVVPTVSYLTGIASTPDKPHGVTLLIFLLLAAMGLVGAVRAGIILWSTHRHRIHLSGDPALPRAQAAQPVDLLTGDRYLLTGMLGIFPLMILYTNLKEFFNADDPMNQADATVLSIIIALLVLGPITQWFGKDFTTVWAMAKR